MSEIRIKSQGAIKLFESDNTSHVTIASPASLSANRTITIPDADVTLGAGTTINNNADNRVITGSGTANTLEGEANLTYNGTFLGVGASADLGTGVHIKTADSGGGVESNADELIVEGSGNTGISILSGTSNVGAVHFNDSGGNERGAFKYNHAADDLQIKTSGAEQVRIFGNGVMACADGVALGVGIANTASNVLDDFEEGTYTYAITTSGGGTVSNRSGYTKLAYTKIGRMVNVVGKVETSGLGDLASQNGDIRLSLPFAIGNFDDFAEQFASSVMWFNTSSMSSMNMLFWKGASNDSFCNLVNVSSTLVDSAIQGNQPGSSLEMRVNITYQAA